MLESFDLLSPRPLPILTCSDTVCYEFNTAVAGDYSQVDEQVWLTDGVLAIFVLIAKIQLTIDVSYKIDLLRTAIVNNTTTTDAHGRVQTTVRPLNRIGSQTVCWQVVYTSK